VNHELQVVVKKILVHLYEDIEFDYDQLCAAEKSLVSRAEFEKLMTWMEEVIP